MAFSEVERARWHADRRNGRLEDEDRVALPVCGHCGNRFAAGDGVVTDEFTICDVCNGD